jgi:uncharacterized membrane protein
LGFSIVGVLGVMALTRISFGRRASLIAGLLMAVAVPDIRFAQEAGQYALMSCVLSWKLVFLCLLMKRDAWRGAVLWGLSAAIAVYSYYGAALTLAAASLVCLA